MVCFNDIPEQVECDISMFVDDTKIYTAVKSIANSQRFQTDLNSWRGGLIIHYLDLTYRSANVCQLGLQPPPHII